MYVAVPAVPMFNSGRGRHASVNSMTREQPQFERLPADCICGGYNLLPFREYPAAGVMPDLEAYRCEKCGHVEIIEKRAE